MILIVGLGNMGSNYEFTRHNVGFMLLDYVAKFYNLNYKLNFKGLVSEGNINNQKILFVKPQTFMNLSGDCVVAICSFYKISPDNVIVFQDDLDLSLGEIRYKTLSSDGGHNGIKDIQNKIGKNIHKIKIGISRPLPSVDVSSYVLGNFNKNDMLQIDVLFTKILNNFDLLISKNFNEFIKKVKED